MQTERVESGHSKKTFRRTKHSPDQILHHIRRALWILAIVYGGCTPPAPPTPAPPGPPSTAHGQAILAWGGNSSGQIGDGFNIQRPIPSLVALPNVQAIAGGGEYSLALTADGRVLEWGGGKMTPTEISGLVSVKQIAAGDRHRLALRNDGTLWAWGDNNRGQLGDGSNLPRPAPVQVVGLTNVISIAAGGNHTLAIRSDFGVWTWGANNDGQLGDGTKNDRSIPAVVPGIQAIEVVASARHSVALTTDLKVLGWGNNDECQLGLDPRDDPFDPIECSEHLRPTIIFETQAPPYPGSKGNAIAAMISATLVVFSDGTVYGFGGHGDAPQGTFRGMCNSDLALGGAVIAVGAPVEQIIAGAEHVLFLTKTGEVWSLGANRAGQVGTGGATLQECPNAISSARVRDVTQLAAGNEHSLALIEGTLTIAPVTLDFGQQPVGTKSPAPLVITVTNGGLAPVTFYDISLPVAGDYTISEDCPDIPALLAPGENCSIRVSFTPTATGLRDGHIVLSNDGKGSSHKITLTGIGT
jgi:alpha-tubulin suppressor-like RCC1 family protein